MTADKPSPFVPKLRFPEFAQGPGWDHATVADLVETVTPPKKLTTSTYLADGRFPIIDQSQSYICGWTNDDEAVITMPLPVIVFGDHTCVLKFVNRPFAQGADGVKILTARRRVSTLYLYHQLTYRPVVMEEYKRHFSALKDKVVCFPDPKSGEQQKIAGCLGSLDDLIAAEGRKLEALRQHKQGLMQRFFPQVGETQPRLRFPEFQDTQEWRVAPLGKLFETTTGGTPDRARPDYWGGEVPWVTTSIVGFNVIESTRESISSAGLSNSSAKVFPKRTVLMALYGQGKTRGKVAMLGVEAATNQACAAILPSDEVDPRFVFLNLSGRYEEIRANSNSGGQKNLSQALVRDLPFAYPKERAEQHRIAECLTALDDQIAAQARKLETLKQHKRGLLQQLFPKPETA